MIITVLLLHAATVQVVIDVTNPWKNDYAKLGFLEGPDSIMDIEDKDPGKLASKPSSSRSHKGECAQPAARGWMRHSGPLDSILRQGLAGTLLCCDTGKAVQDKPRNQAGAMEVLLARWLQQNKALMLHSSSSSRALRVKMHSRAAQ